MANNEDMHEDTVPAPVEPKPDTGWTMIPPLGTPHNPPADPEFTKPTESAETEE